MGAFSCSLYRNLGLTIEVEGGVLMSVPVGGGRVFMTSRSVLLDAHIV